MKTALKSLRQEVRAKNFLLKHDNLKTFTQFQFGYCKAYLAWRMFWAVYFTVMILAKGPHIHKVFGSKYFILLSNLAYLCLTVAVIFDLCTCAFVAFKRSDIRNGDCSDMPWYIKTTWVLFNTYNTINIITSLGYWVFIYKDPSQLDFNNVETHIMNIVYVILNLVVTGVPVRLFHFWHPGVAFALYIVFTIIYHLAGGLNHYGNPYIYPIINWNKPGRAVAYSLISLFVGVPIIHGMIAFIHWIKCLAWRKCCVPEHSKYDVS